MGMRADQVPQPGDRSRAVVAVILVVPMTMVMSMVVPMTVVMSMVVTVLCH